MKLNETLKAFWELESIGIAEKENSVHDKFEDQIKFENNRYVVNLPFKEDHPLIEDFNLTMNRLENLMKKFKRDPELLKQYDDVIKPQKDLGIIEKAEDEGKLGETHYLPHRRIIREDKTSTRLRVVFDASSKFNGPSLNNCLYKGPSSNPLLHEVLLRFRSYQIAITADISKAFLQISVAPEDRDYMRFLSFDDVLADCPTFERNRFARVIFGVNSSPFLLAATLRIHLDRYNEIDPDFVKRVLRSLYVDDFSSRTNNVEKGVDLYKKLLPD